MKHIGQIFKGLWSSWAELNDLLTWKKTQSCLCKSFDCMLFASVCIQIHLFKLYKQFVRLMSSSCSVCFFCTKIRIRKYFSFWFLLSCIWMNKVMQNSFLNFQIFGCTEFCPHPPLLHGFLLLSYLVFLQQPQLGRVASFITIQSLF